MRLDEVRAAALSRELMLQPPLSTFRGMFSDGNVSYGIEPAATGEVSWHRISIATAFEAISVAVGISRVETEGWLFFRSFAVLWRGAIAHA